MQVSNKSLKRQPLTQGFHAEVSAQAKARQQGKADVFGKEQRGEGSDPLKTP